MITQSKVKKDEQKKKNEKDKKFKLWKYTSGFSLVAFDFFLEPKKEL